MSTPKVMLSVVVRPRNVPYDLLELSVEGDSIIEQPFRQVQYSDTRENVKASLISPEMALRCAIQPSEQGKKIVVAFYAWSSGHIDDPATPNNESLTLIDMKETDKRITLSGNFNPYPKKA